MTEAEWVAGSAAADMILFVEPMTTDRKLHLYGIACCRRIAPLLPHEASLRGVAVIEEFVEGRATAEEVAAVNWDVEGAAFGFDYSSPASNPLTAAVAARLTDTDVRELVNSPNARYEHLHDVLRSAAYFADYTVVPVPQVRHLKESPDVLRNRSFLFEPFARCIFGNPFRPVAFSRSWLMPTAVGIARGVYDDRAFDRLPILADALQDAGCEDEQVLAHCRGGGPHVRGCWVVDGVLGLK